VLAFLVASLLAFYMLSPSSHWDPTTAPVGQSTPIIYEPKEARPATPEAPDRSNSDSSPPPVPPRCPVTKVSMLYGAHKFSQLEDALKLHHRHSERWGSGFVSLNRDLTTRKLYSKHYFLLSTMLHELSKPEGERQQWLL
jgi:hypothetical protein